MILKRKKGVKMEVEMTELEKEMLNAVKGACDEIYKQQTLPSVAPWTIAITKELVQLGKNIIW